MKTIEAAKELNYYLSLPYTTVLKKDEEGDIVAHIEELDGCVSHGADEVEAITNLKSMQTAWIEACIESGREVPEPEPEEALPSGKYLQRLPRSLHQRLIRLAKREGVSLNALTTALLTDAATAKLFGEVAVETMVASFAAHSIPGVQILTHPAHHGHGENWLQKAQHWQMIDYVGTPGIAHKVQQVMRMVVPEDRTEEIEHANEKETLTFRHSH